ncbi:MAG TPA: hypothetical protein DDY32_08695 [Desulfobulbaceae bacterium]|nr:hypothetical protein [Desulfobulbaceae bacterium]
MDTDDRRWKMMQRHLGYSDEEMISFKNDPRNAAVLNSGGELANKTIILEVVESHGCNSKHKVGDKFFFDAFGNLLTELCPKRVCGYSLNAALMMVFTANEMLFAGLDPNAIRFKRAGCFDVGLECGGWGRIVLELSVVDKQTA